VGNERNATAERQEVKYLIDLPLAQQVIHMSAGFIEPDAHGSDGHYEIASLYFDDDRWSSANESYEGIKDRCKLRMRCYSFAPNAPVWAEIKRRRGTTVIKSRARIPRTVAHAVCRGEMVDPALSLDPEAFAEFLYERERRWMVPRLWVRYKRLAFTSAFGDDARLTVDRFVEVQEPHEDAYTIRNDFWRPIPVSPECVLELKYNAAYPHWMQLLVRAVNIQAQSVSKYGRGASVFLDDGMRVSAAWSQGWTGI
jgi:hypothetical protein